LGLGRIEIEFRGKKVSGLQEGKVSWGAAETPGRHRRTQIQVAAKLWRSRVPQKKDRSRVVGKEGEQQHGLVTSPFQKVRSQSNILLLYYFQVGHRPWYFGPTHQAQILPGYQQQESSNLFLPK